MPDLDNICNSVPDDDHFGPSFVRYHEDVETDGFLLPSSCSSEHELYDTPTLVANDNAPTSSSSLEERPSVEENVSLQWSEDFKLHTALNEKKISTLASPPASVPTPDPPSERPLVRDDTLYNDPVVLNQRSRQGRQFKPRRISDIANFVDAVLDTDIPIEHVTAVVQNSHGTDFDLQTMDGADPAAFLPEPQLLNYRP
jgi:hypothetical protein